VCVWHSGCNVGACVRIYGRAGMASRYCGCGLEVGLWVCGVGGERGQGLQILALMQGMAYVVEVEYGVATGLGFHVTDAGAV